VRIRGKLGNVPGRKRKREREKEIKTVRGRTRVREKEVEVRKAETSEGNLELANTLKT
jgi:hypothetical protein